MQFADPAFPHLYAVGDVADSGAHKAARPAVAQAVAAAKNIAAMIEGKPPTEEIVVGPAGIHLTLGLVGFIQKNTATKKGIVADDSGTDQEYHLSEPEH